MKAKAQGEILSEEEQFQQLARDIDVMLQRKLKAGDMAKRLMNVGWRKPSPGPTPYPICDKCGLDLRGVMSHVCKDEAVKTKYTKICPECKQFITHPISAMHPKSTDWNKGGKMAEEYLNAENQEWMNAPGGKPCQPKMWPKRIEFPGKDSNNYTVWGEAYAMGANAMRDAFFRVINGGKE